MNHSSTYVYLFYLFMHFVVTSSFRTLVVNGLVNKIVFATFQLINVLHI